MYDNPINIALRLLEAATENLSQHYYDDFVEKNADSAVRSGMKSLIIRRQMGNCCEFCASLSGIYDYGSGDYPDKIFTRHENCRCMVTFKTEKGGYTDVWSKVEYKSQKEARKAREKEILAEDKNYQKYLRKKEVAKAEGEKFADVTEYWENKPKEYPAEVIETGDTFEINGKLIPVNGPNKEIDYSPSDQEKKTAKWYTETFGGRLQLMPKINKPEKNPLGDFKRLSDGVLIDLKSPTGGGKWVIQGQVDDHKDQAKHFIIDISKSKIGNNLNEVFRQTEEVMNRDRLEWIQEIMLIKDEKIIRVYERI